MNEQIHEQLSALMDGELARDEARFLLKRIEGNRELPLRWGRYHVARQALCGRELALCTGFADAVMARLDQEQLPRRNRHVWLRWGAGGAIAASVAVAALVVTRPAITPVAAPGSALARNASPSTGLATSATAPIRSSVAAFQTPMLAPSAGVETAPASFGTDSEPVVLEPRMQPYLIRHYQATGASGQSNFVPYVLLGAPIRENATPPSAQSVAPIH